MATAPSSTSTSTPPPLNTIRKPIAILDRPSSSEISPAATTLSACFPTDPVLRWVLSQSPSTKPNAHTSLIDNIPFRDTFFTAVVTAGRTGGGTVTSISQSDSTNEYDCVGILIPPGHDPDQPSNFLKQWRSLFWLIYTAGWRCSYRMLLQYPALLKRMKKSTFTPAQLKSIDFYYVFFLGTLETARGQGLASAWMRRCQEQARKEGKPIWLESSTENSRDLYAWLGWEEVVVEVVGKGQVDREGKPKKGGEGARLWGMVWWPDEKKGNEGADGGKGVK